MNNHDVGLNYVTLIGVAAVIFCLVAAGLRAHAEHKRQKRSAWFSNRG